MEENGVGLVGNADILSVYPGIKIFVFLSFIVGIVLLNKIINRYFSKRINNKIYFYIFKIISIVLIMFGLELFFNNSYLNNLYKHKADYCSDIITWDSGFTYCKEEYINVFKAKLHINELGSLTVLLTMFVLLYYKKFNLLIGIIILLVLVLFVLSINYIDIYRTFIKLS